MTSIVDYTIPSEPKEKVNVIKWSSSTDENNVTNNNDDIKKETTSSTIDLIENHKDRIEYAAKVVETFKEAKSHLQRGSKNSALGQYHWAYDDYDRGLNALSKAIEMETNVEKKDSMKNILLKYLKRAVDVKELLEKKDSMQKQISPVRSSKPTMISEDQETPFVTTEDIKIVQTENFEYKVIFPNEDIIDSSSTAEDEVKISTPSVSEIIASMEETKVQQKTSPNGIKTKNKNTREVIHRRIMEVVDKKDKCNKVKKKKKKKKKLCKINRKKSNNITTTPIKLKSKNNNKPTWNNEYDTTPIHLMEDGKHSKNDKVASPSLKYGKSRNNISPPRIRSNKIPRTPKSSKQIRTRTTTTGRSSTKKYTNVSSRVNSNNKSYGNNSNRNGNSNDNSESTKFESIVNSEIMHGSAGVTWEDVAGLTLAKHTLQEAVILPMIRPDIFNGIRAPSKGVLLYGPPGTGKTMLAKAVATESNATFFSISASSLTSKWVGESSKLVRALFDLANKKAPSVVFIDEIDSMLTKRKSSEHNGGRQLKTEFLVQFDGVRTSERKGHVLIIGATNRPWDLDDAVLRRLAKRVHIPLPDEMARRGIIENLMCKQNCEVTEDELNWIIQVTENYSGSDLKALCHEAALGPLRGLGEEIANIEADDVRPIEVTDFEEAITVVRPSVGSKERFEEWTRKFGTTS